MATKKPNKNEEENSDKKDSKKKMNLVDTLDALSKDIQIGEFITKESPIRNIEAIPTGIATLDNALGIGGIPRGRIIEVYGPESGGKTTTSLFIAKAFQNHFFKNRNRNGRVLFIDAEHALDIEWAKNLGVNTEDMIINQPSSGESTFKIIEHVAPTMGIELVIVDSVAALTPLKVLEGEVDDYNVGAHARLMSNGMKRILKPVSVYGMTVLFINQIREKPNAMFQNPETTTGGRALKFYASVRMEIKKKEAIKDGETHIGNKVAVKTIKNKTAPPFRVAEFSIYFGSSSLPIYGPWPAESLFDMALTAKVIQQNSSSYKFDGKQIGNGKLNAIKAIHGSDTLFSSIKKAVDNIYASTMLPPENIVETEEELEDGDDTV